MEEEPRLPLSASSTQTFSPSLLPSSPGLSMGRFVLICTLALAAGLCATTAEAQAPVTLRIVFPEGFSTRQMTDRVA